jgi:hypothetical protein
MRRALLLSVVFVSGCHQTSAPPAADASGPNPVKARKEMTQLLNKADALTASVSTPPPVVAAPEPGPRQPETVPSAPVAPANSPQPAPAKPNADVVRDQALAGFRDRLVTLRRTAEASRLKKDRYQQVCQGGKVSQSECQQLTADIADASTTIERELGDIEQAALRARIDSGAMHDLLTRYGF